MHRLSPPRPLRPRLSLLIATLALAVTGAPALANGGSALDLIYAAQGAATVRPAVVPSPTAMMTAMRGEGGGMATPAAGRRAGGIFGSIAIAVGRTPLDARFRHAARPARTGADMPWHALLKAGAGQGRRAKAALVNAWVNRRVHFASDAAGVAGDRWANVEETVARGRGDCEDYAIAKLQLLAALDVPASDLMLVIVRDLVRRADHAVLVVRDGEGGLMLLDNATDRIDDATVPSDYRPIFSFAGDRSFIHGYPAEAPAPAMATMLVNAPAAPRSVLSTLALASN